jgi:hypothetical protein
MAIDMLEYNELGALAPMRIGGNTSFVDENDVTPYKNFTGEDQFFNLFGSQKRKASVAQVEKDANAKWAQYDQKTCGGIELLLADTQVEIERITKMMASNNGFDLPIQLKIARSAQANAKMLQNQYDCVRKAEQAKIEEERKSSLDALTKISDLTVDKAKQDLLGTDKNADGNAASGNKKLLMYGGIGLGALVVIALIARR